MKKPQKSAASRYAPIQMYLQRTLALVPASHVVTWIS
ncbi:hypothetical protein BVI434_280018 [Burkholderia vietnamiensis]|nr:hypothetical protein BVI434_280018 [Burkholderia vietnamiensis]